MSISGSTMAAVVVVVGAGLAVPEEAPPPAEASPSGLWNKKRKDHGEEY